MVWVWGMHTVKAAIRKRSRSVKKILVTNQGLVKLKNFFSQLEDEISDFNSLRFLNITEIVPVAKMDQKFGKAHQGIAIQTEQVRFWDLNEWIETQSENSLLIACDLIEDPHNLGAIIRTAAAFKANGILVTQDKQAPFEGALAKTAAGGLEFIPIIKVVNLSTALNTLKKKYYMVYGLDEDGQKDWSIIKPKNGLNKNVLVAGQEGKGLRRLTKSACDVTLAIDTNKDFPTLNVSVATAVAISKFSEFL